MNATMNAPEASTRDRLTHGLQQVVDEANHLLKDAAHTGAEQINAARDRLDTQLRHAKVELRRLEGDALETTKRAARATDHAVHEHPYASMGVAAGVGLLLGMLIIRR